MKWHWIPGGWLRLIVVVGLLTGGALTDGVVSTVLLVMGMVALVFSYLVTAANVRKKNKEAKKNQPEE